MLLKNQGPFYALLSGLFFGLLGYFGLSAISDNLSVYTMLFWRFVVASLSILLLLLPQIKSITLHRWELFKVFLNGVAFYSTSSILYFLASEHIGSGLAMVIFFTYPVFVMLINQLMYQLPVSRVYFIALLIIGLGMVLLMDGRLQAFDVTGIALSLLSALVYALYILASKRSVIAPLPSTLLLSLGCMFTCLIAAILDNSFDIPTTMHTWINIVGIGIICTALPILFLLKGLRYLNATEASLLSVFEPIFVVIFGVMLLNEPINLTQVMGIIMLLGGALLSLLNQKLIQLYECSS